MDESYTVSAQMVDVGGRKAAQSDVWPGATDTSRWAVGQQVVDRRELVIHQDAVPGVYELLLSIYWIDPTPELRRLRIIDTEGRILPSDSWVLGQVRIAP
jgi:hypothetical protein